MFSATYDSVFYTSKPTGKEPAITERLQLAAPRQYSEAQFCDHVRRGGTFVCACFRPLTKDQYRERKQENAAIRQRNNKRHSANLELAKQGKELLTLENTRPLCGSFISQQLLAVDIDNEGSGKMPLHEGDEGYLDPYTALTRADALSLRPLALYFTFSSTLDHLKYRLVFDLHEAITDEQAARKAVSTLLALYPEGDRACRNLNRQTSWLHYRCLHHLDLVAGNLRAYCVFGARYFVDVWALIKRKAPMHGRSDQANCTMHRTRGANGRTRTVPL